MDATQDFSNFTPKKIRAFQDKKGPDIVDAAFGWFHEAYIDKLGNLYVCAKAKVPSVKVREQPDGERDLTKVTSLPAPVQQVSFTRKRMFVVCTDGTLHSFKIVE